MWSQNAENAQFLQKCYGSFDLCNGEALPRYQNIQEQAFCFNASRPLIKKTAEEKEQLYLDHNRITGVCSVEEQS